ncbi:hypothetical protein KM043_007365 [Ampulex compressa]|nr:hypothetical protein KM043_007365 [Ampulex compressa]
MNSFSDLSQLSDISSISRISRSNNSRFITTTDSLHNLLEYQSNITHNASKISTTSNSGNSCLEKAYKSLSLCEDSTADYVKNKMIVDCIKEASSNAGKRLSENVVAKLKGLLVLHEMDKYMHFPPTVKHTQEELTVLGITDLPKYELGYEERLDIKCCVESILREKIHKFILRYESSGVVLKEILRNNERNAPSRLLESHSMRILQWKDKIDQLCTQYEVDILKSKDLIEKWSQLKYKDMTKIYLIKSEHLLLQAEVAEVQAKITKLSCIMRMFKETPTTIHAFKMLSEIVEEKLNALTNNIRNKEDLKKSYDNLKGTEYDNVLKNYLHFCKAIKKKKQILEMM